MFLSFSPSFSFFLLTARNLPLLVDHCPVQYKYSFHTQMKQNNLCQSLLSDSMEQFEAQYMYIVTVSADVICKGSDWFILQLVLLLSKIGS